MVLYLKELKITDVLAVDFLDQPDKYGLVEACKQLFLLGALDADGNITPQGRQLAKIPVEPALGRVLLAATAAGDILPEVLTIVAMLGKKGQNPMKAGPLKQRPISIASTVYRAWASIRYRDLNPWAEEWCHEQFRGGRPRGETKDLTVEDGVDLEDAHLDGVCLYGSVRARRRKSERADA